jgi:hypothetical protein
MIFKKLTFFQTFNAMRIFLSMQYDKAQSDHIGTICGSLNLWKKKPDWKENPDTFDPTAWKDWLKSVSKTLHDFNINRNPKTIIFNEEIAFICMQNYLQCFYDQTPWEDVGIILENLKNSEQIDTDPTWQQWLQAVDHSINETYELDVYFDPFTGERI